MVDVRRFRTITTGVGGLPGYNNFYFLANGTSPTIAAQREGFVNAFPLWQQLLPAGTSVTLQPEVVTIDTVTGNTSGVAQIAPLTVGGSGTGTLPYATCGLVKYSTGSFNGARRVVGRSFLSPMSAQANENGQPTTLAVQRLAAIGQALFTAGNGTFAIYSPTLATAFPVTTVTASNKWAVLRSRRD